MTPRQAADYVAAVVGIMRGATGILQALEEAVQLMSGTAFEPLSAALTFRPELGSGTESFGAGLDALADQIGAPCLHTLALAVRVSGHGGAMSTDYLMSCAELDARVAAPCHRTAADYVVAVLNLMESGVGFCGAVTGAIELVHGAHSADLVDQLSGLNGPNPWADLLDRLRRLASEWASPALLSLAEALDAAVHGTGPSRSMEDYLLHCAKIEVAGCEPEATWLSASPPDRASASG
ncbi:MAG: hypothetical protein ACRDY2_08245 [Acidimicrobiales bacterium]